MFKDYYKILGISMQASPEEVKSAYRDMSKKYHPDRNPNVDTTTMMQDINEAYAILKDESKRSRYDQEYKRFTQYYEKENVADEKQSWSYDYTVENETVKNDIEDARSFAEELVREFMSSFKKASKDAAEGAVGAVKGFIPVIIIMFVVGLCMRACLSANSRANDVSFNSNSLHTDFSNPNGNVSVCEEPKGVCNLNEWTRYYVDNQAFSISVPPTMELRHDNDVYTKVLKNVGLSVNSDHVVFQQKELSEFSQNALSHYARIMISHSIGDYDDFYKYNESFPIDYEVRQYLKSIALNNSNPYKLIGEPTYRWITIGACKALEMKYRRNGDKGNTTNCRFYFLYNYNEMVQMIVSYREQESDIWAEDLSKVIETFKWKTLK